MTSTALLGQFVVADADTKTTIFTSGITPVEIVDGAYGSPSILDSSITVDGTSGPMYDLKVTLSHTWPADLIMALIHEESRRAVILLADNGGDHDLVEVPLRFADDGTALPVDASPLEPGTTYRPVGIVSLDDLTVQGLPPLNHKLDRTLTYGENLAVFDGVVPDGTWTLHIEDHLPNNVGSLGSWSISFVTEIDPPVTTSTTTTPAITTTTATTTAPSSTTSTTMAERLSPVSRLDCSDEGWRTLGNDRGESFVNKHDCVRFVDQTVVRDGDHRSHRRVGARAHGKRRPEQHSPTSGSPRSGTPSSGSPGSGVPNSGRN